jgi:hypothetical protein
LNRSASFLLLNFLILILIFQSFIVRKTQLVPFRYVLSASGKGFGSNLKKSRSVDRKSKKPHESRAFEIIALGENKKKVLLPWWLREDEARNPDVLPSYSVWWTDRNFPVDNSWSIRTLIIEAKRRGVDTTGNKEDLIFRINNAHFLHSLADDNFVAPVIVDDSANLTAVACYPEVYERLESTPEQE